MLKTLKFILLNNINENWVDKNDGKGLIWIKSLFLKAPSKKWWKNIFINIFMNLVIIRFSKEFPWLLSFYWDGDHEENVHFEKKSWFL